MTSITIDIDEKNKESNNFIATIAALVLSKSFARIRHIPNRTTRRAIKDAEAGKTFTATSVEDLFRQLNA